MMKGCRQLSFALLTTSCGLLDARNDDGTPEFDGTLRERRGAGWSGGRASAETGGAAAQSSGGVVLEGTGGQATMAGSAGESAFGSGGSNTSCGCDQGSRGGDVTCAAFTVELGSDAVLWTCDSPPYPALVEAGCEGFGSGIFRMCCPKTVSVDDFCRHH